MKKLILFHCFFFFVLGTSQTIAEGKIVEIKNFIKGKSYNQDLAIFIDFKIPSNKFRFFIYDLKNSKILEKAIVSHGSGSVIRNEIGLRFSNEEGSYQSSLGKYEISSKYFGNFGWSYRLKGLDKTNSNALKRAIVMHSYSCVKDEESTQPACLSLGCPMVSTDFFKMVEKYVDTSKKVILMYAYY